MELQFDKRLFRVQLVAINAFALIVAVVAFFAFDGSFLFLAVLLALGNVGWYFLIYRAARILSIKATPQTIHFSYNQGIPSKELAMNSIDLGLEERNHHNGGKHHVLVVRKGAEVITEINPGNSGFTKDDLEALEGYCKRQQEKTTGETG